MQTGRQRSRDVRSDPDISASGAGDLCKDGRDPAVCKAGKITEQETVLYDSVLSYTGSRGEGRERALWK